MDETTDGIAKRKHRAGHKPPASGRGPGGWFEHDGVIYESRLRKGGRGGRPPLRPPLHRPDLAASPLAGRGRCPAGRAAPEKRDPAARGARGGVCGSTGA